jgi:hypothetical protein
MKIGLIGSAPSSCALAPYEDQSWKFWACSPGVAGMVRRVDAFFELHRYRPEGEDGWTKEFIAWMNGIDVPVYLAEALPGVIPKGVVYPVEEMIGDFGRNWFTSSIAWMFALAITQKPDEIGLWGVDMSATDEYGWQRAGCHRFIEIAKERGIKVTVPPESDLLQPPALYGIGMSDPKWVKWRVHMTELKQMQAKAQQAHAAAERDVHFYNGATQTMRYMMNTWMGKR